MKGDDLITITTYRCQGDRCGRSTFNEADLLDGLCPKCWRNEHRRAFQVARDFVARNRRALPANPKLGILALCVAPEYESPWETIKRELADLLDAFDFDHPVTCELDEMRADPRYIVQGFERRPGTRPNMPAEAPTSPKEATVIDIRNLDKAAVLAALYNATLPLGMGYLQPKSGNSMDVEEARAILAEYPRPRFDYVQGRPLKVDLGDDSFDPRLFDRDAGEGAAAKAIATLRGFATPDPIGIPGPGSHGESPQ